MIDEVLRDYIEEKAASDSGYAVALAVLELVEAQKTIGVHLKYLGVGDAATTMGAIEYLAVRLADAIKEAGQ
jgi:hypothetical protein